jgi:hypothetical protein
VSDDENEDVEDVSDDEDEWIYGGRKKVGEKREGSR